MHIIQYSDEINIKIKSPIIFIGIPDVGLVGSIAVSYIVERLDMKEIGYIDSELLPPIVLVKDGMVKNPIRLYANTNDSILAVVSDIPLLPPLITEFLNGFIPFIKSLNPRLVVNITGIAVQNRLQIDKPQVLYILTDTDSLKPNAIEFKDGIIAGVYASIVRSCMNSRIPTLTLLAQSHLNFPDPAASIEALEVVNSTIALNIDLSELRQEAELIRIKNRELMKQTESMLAKAAMKGSPTFYG